MKIAIGCDHAGFELKEEIKKYLESKEIAIEDKGAYSAESVDYPDYAHAVARAVENKSCDWGILICGSAQGVAMTANKHQQVRAAVVWKEEIAQLSRQHNNANIICLPARFMDSQTAIKSIEIFSETNFEGGRHEKRVEKISCGDVLL